MPIDFDCVDLPTIQRLLGHGHISTSMRYLQFSLDSVQSNGARSLLLRLDAEELHDVGVYFKLAPDIGGELLRGPTEELRSIHFRDHIR